MPLTRNSRFARISTSPREERGEVKSEHAKRLGEIYRSLSPSFTVSFTGRGSGSGALSGELALNGEQNALKITEDIVVPKSKHAISVGEQALISFHIRSRFTVLSAVHLNNKKSFAANEIADITANRLLPHKFMPIDLTAANAIPQDCLRIRLIDAQLPRDSDHLPILSAHCLALTRIAPDDASHRRGNPTSPAKGGERLKNHPTSPFIAFTGALSGNTVCASTVSAMPR
jgi:hypothetical protein